MPAVLEHGPASAPPVNLQTPLGLLQEESFRVKERPYYQYNLLVGIVPGGGALS